MVELSPQLARLFREDLIVIDGPALNRPPLSQLPEVNAKIDELGVRSGIAQGLRGPRGEVAPVTVSFKLAGSSERLYMIAHGQQPRQLVGLLKMGPKNLFHYSAQGQLRQLDQQYCCLDFYVHEDWQRKGVGHALFAAMLEHENLTPDKLAYDVRRRSTRPARLTSHASRSTLPSPRPRLPRLPLRPCPAKLRLLLRPARSAAPLAQAARLPAQALRPHRVRAAAEQLCHLRESLRHAEAQGANGVRLAVGPAAHRARQQPPLPLRRRP